MKREGAKYISRIEVRPNSSGSQNSQEYGVFTPRKKAGQERSHECNHPELVCPTINGYLAD